MSVSLKRWFLPFLLLGLSGLAVAATPVLRTGDGMGTVEGYDAVQRTIVIGGQRVGLSGTAAVSLEGQLAQHRLAPRQQFAAKFNLMPGGDGSLIVESIYVVPPKRP
jgi:hypothetical protein